MSVRPATIVGRANGRSMRALTTPWPRKRSRTSTHAITVPMTAFATETSADSASVSFSADTAAGSPTASRNPPQPAPVDSHTTAASGSSTMRLR
jgi:hypothetical protein